eukprot:10642372-Karenia_brevis.AAC.1
MTKRNVLVQPDCTPTPIEVVDRHGDDITINVNLHPDADIRRDVVDQMREHENLPRMAWTDDLFHRKDIVPFGALDEEDSVAAGSEKD